MSHSENSNKQEDDSESFWDEFLAMIAGLFATGFFENHKEHFHAEHTEEEHCLWDIFL